MILPPLWSAEIEAEVRRQSYNADTRHQPTEVAFCRKCVLSNQRPYVTIDNDGVCSACRYAEHKHHQIDWPARGARLRALLADPNTRGRRVDGMGPAWDCIVPCSGGKDSSTVAHVLKTEHDRHPLCITWAPFVYTDIGRRNYDAFNHAGFDGLVAYPNGLVHRKLARIAFEFYGDAWMPFAYGQLHYALYIALRFGIKLIFLGENGEAEYGGPQQANDQPAFSFGDWEIAYLKGAGVRKLVTFGRTVGAISADEAERLNQFYEMPDPKLLRDMGVQVHWLGFYRNWTPQWNYYHAQEHTGFTANPERSEGTYSKYASLDDKFDGFHYWMGHVKFGIGRATSDAAHEVRDGHIDRDEAIALVSRYDGEFPMRYFPEFKDYLGLDDERFFDVADRFRKPHLWRKVTVQGDKDWDLDAQGHTIAANSNRPFRTQQWELRARVG